MTITVEPKTRSEAAAVGKAKFFTGRVCAKGHRSFRYTSTGTCAACVKQHGRKYSQEKRNVVRGFQQIRVTVHVDEIPQVLRFVDALNAARNLMV